MDGPGFDMKDGWHDVSVMLNLPAEKVCHGSEAEAPEFKVSGLYYRQIIEVIKAAFREPNAKNFHIAPFKLFWQSSADVPPERVITELYTADAFIQEHE